MVISTNSTLNSELSHLTIDDLLGPMPESFRLGGPGPFVINLRSSSVAMTLPTADTEIGQHGHVYQIQRREEDAVRYRLRLGPFTSEDDADSLLAKVREMYPSALTARATPEDLRVFEALGKNSPISRAHRRPFCRTAADRSHGSRAETADPARCGARAHLAGDDSSPGAHAGKGAGENAARSDILRPRCLTLHWTAHIRYGA
jgi:hypothetical protein